MRRPGSVLRARAGAAASWIALAACCSLTAGCAGSTNAASTAPPPDAASAYAGAVNLSAADLPEMSQAAAEAPAPAPTAQGAAFARCDGESDPRLRVAEIQSAEFSAGRAAAGKLVRSVVEVLPSPALAENNLVAFQN